MMRTAVRKAGNEITTGILAKLEGVKNNGTDHSWMARCPAHADHTASLGISEVDDRVLLHCLAGCSFTSVCSALRIKESDTFFKPLAPVVPKEVARYCYHNTAGEEVFQIVRYNPKRFLACRVDHGQTVWNLRGVVPVIFQLPLVLDAIQRGKPIYVCEGEKDCLNLGKYGLVATTNALGGASQWTETHSAYLKGAHVVLLPDNDNTGRQHMIDIANGVKPYVASIRLVVLPGLREKGDVSDYLDDGHTIAELDAIIRDTAPFNMEQVKPYRVPLTVLTNNDSYDITTVDAKGIEKIKKMYDARQIADIRNDLIEITANWPRRLGSNLFYDKNQHIQWLKSPDAVFAWLGDKLNVSWRAGVGANENTFASKAEFFHNLTQTVVNYDAIETLPHEPRFPTHYYSWRADQEYKPNGQYFNTLMNRFDQYATETDKWLIRCMFMAPAWGGGHGTRPAFAVTANEPGCGKSFITTAVGQLYTNMFEFKPGLHNEDELIQRLLTPEHLATRVVRIDNLKSDFASGTIEGLMTQAYISGKQMYIGEAKRPNTLTWLITANGIRVSPDIAQRAFIIKVVKPRMNKMWEEETRNYINTHKTRIIMDIIWQLQQPAVEWNVDERHSEFIDGVVARCGCPDPTSVMVEVMARQGESDVEGEESQELLAEIRNSEEKYWLSSHDANSYAQGNGGWIWLHPTNLMEIYNKFSGTRYTMRGVKGVLRRYIRAGKYGLDAGAVVQEHVRTGVKGFIIWMDGA